MLFFITVSLRRYMPPTNRSMMLMKVIKIMSIQWMDGSYTVLSGTAGTVASARVVTAVKLASWLNPFWPLLLIVLSDLTSSS